MKLICTVCITQFLNIIKYNPPAGTTTLGILNALVTDLGNLVTIYFFLGKGNVLDKHSTNLEISESQMTNKCFLVLKTKHGYTIAVRF